MTVGQTTGPNKSRTRIDRHSLWYRRTWGEAVTQVNHQLLTQIKILRKAQQRVIELGIIDPSGHAIWGPPTSYNSDRLTFQVKQNALQSNLSTWGPRESRSWLLTEVGEGTSCPNIQEREHFPNIYEYQGRLSLYPLKLMIDQILHIIKHQPWVKLLKPTKHNTDPLEAGYYAFHGSRRHATLYCWALKRHLEDLVQCGYLAKTRGSKPASPASLQCQVAELEARVSTSSQFRNARLEPCVSISSQCQNARLEARIPALLQYQDA